MDDCAAVSENGNLSPTIRTGRMETAVSDFFATLCVAVLLGTAVGQSPPVAPAPTFHIEGTIDSATNGSVPRVEVSFVSEQTTRTVEVDDKGFYQIDLPVGAYNMTAAFPPLPNHVSPLTKYVRFFQVKSPARIDLDGALYGNYDCDGVWGGGSAEEQQQLYQDSCGGADSFPAPSREGVPFRLDIRYGRRERGDGSILYGKGVVDRPVLVTYNLFALQAGSVTYDEKSRIVSASGDILIEDQFGQSHTETAAFKIENGSAVRLSKEDAIKAQKLGEDRRPEQMTFASEAAPGEGPVKKPVEIPHGALQVLRSNLSSSTINCNKSNGGLTPEEVPESWLVASEIHLHGADEADLLVQPKDLHQRPAPNRCLFGTHAVPFWVLGNTTGGYKLLLKTFADALVILDSRTNGYRDILVVSLTAATATNLRFTFDGSQYQLFEKK